MHKKDRTEKLKNNIRYLIKSRGETQLSLCNSSGLTRTTIYNILEGRVVHAQQSTVRKISDFFGVSYKEIETIDFEEKETIESSLSPNGNMNPAAVPVIRERLLIQSLNKKIGELTIAHPLTYYFGAASNVIGVLLENEISGMNEPGDILIVKRGLTNGSGIKLGYEKATSKIILSESTHFDQARTCIVGEVIEERFNGKQ
ncbi:helix-turn-helix transcriptional regulator [Pseudomonas sp. PDM04]|uniref:helix-turn-helix transcriptional regulator n=1 Tax=Pseudomonas sp. PDM04 TaxID=2769296 RepID=UPI00177CAA11|nr:helix-turn-helix transcriptional regulator [Pseudomonas sp. PDM04]MBD9440483.1 helix-turn-helix transcriptional regulator [Pseudomonas sp. PDM04]